MTYDPCPFVFYSRLERASGYVVFATSSDCAAIGAGSVRGIQRRQIFREEVGVRSAAYRFYCDPAYQTPGLKVSKFFVLQRFALSARSSSVCPSATAIKREAAVWAPPESPRLIPVDAARLWLRWTRSRSSVPKRPPAKTLRERGGAGRLCGSLVDLVFSTTKPQMSRSMFRLYR